MIQRIQTLFWLINLLLLLLGYYFFPWPDSTFPFDATAVPVKEIFVGGVAVIQLITLLGYKKRLLQLRFTLILQGLYALVFGLFALPLVAKPAVRFLGLGRSVGSVNAVVSTCLPCRTTGRAFGPFRGSHTLKGAAFSQFNNF